MSTREDLGTIYRDLEALFIADAVRDGALDRSRRFCDAPAYQAFQRVSAALGIPREELEGPIENGTLGQIGGPERKSNKSPPGDLSFPRE